MAGTTPETIAVSVRDRVTWITLNRPDALNAWTLQLGRELLSALESAAADDEVRAIVLSGAGRAFSSGADLKAGEIVGEDGRVDVLSGLREVFNPAILRVRTIEKPVIAAVNGVAAGIGCSLALAADLVLVAQSAYFLLAFANIGLALDGGASPLLVGRIGHTRASELALLADRVDAAHALEWGLATRVVADGDLEEAAGTLAAKFAAGAPGSYATIKRTLNEAAFPRLAEMMDAEAVLQQQRAESADFIEGVSAFLQKRPPAFTGR